MLGSLALVGGGVVTLVAGLFAKSAYEHRDIVFAFRLVAEVEAAGGRYTGAGVVEVRWRYNSVWLRMLDEGPSRSASVNGEAIAVDMKSDGILFVTLMGAPVGSISTLPFAVLRPGQGPPRDFDAYLRQLADEPGVRNIPMGTLPEVLWLADPADPRTIDCYDWQVNTRSRTHGLQPRIVRATLQMVHEPPTVGIDRLLPWLQAARRAEADHDNFHRYDIDVGSGTAAHDCQPRTTDFIRGR